MPKTTYEHGKMVPIDLGLCPRVDKNLPGRWRKRGYNAPQYWSASKPHILPWLVFHTASSTRIFQEISSLRWTILGAGRQQRPLSYRTDSGGIYYLATQRLSRRAGAWLSLGPLPARGETKVLDGVKLFPAFNKGIHTSTKHQKQQWSRTASYLCEQLLRCGSASDDMVKIESNGSL